MVDSAGGGRIVKLDPARPLSERAAGGGVRAGGVDAVVVGGSGGYGLGEVLSLLTRLRRYSLPLALEVSDPGRAVSRLRSLPDADGAEQPARSIG